MKTTASIIPETEHHSLRNTMQFDENTIRNVVAQAAQLAPYHREETIHQAHPKPVSMGVL